MDAELKAEFTPIAEQLRVNENKIISELNEVQGQPMDIGGYYKPDHELEAAAMRPSPTLNQLIS